MDRVAKAAETAQYSVTASPGGFDLKTDIGNRQWLDHLRQVGITQAHLHHVAVEGMTYKIISDSRDLSWGKGVPMLATPKEVRKASQGVKRTMAARGALARSEEIRDPFGAEAGRRVIIAAGDQMGMTHKQTGRRLEIALTATAVILTVAISFAVAVWVLFFN